MSARALILTGPDDDGVFLQARDDLAAAAAQAGADIVLAAAPPYRTRGRWGTSAVAERLNEALHATAAEPVVIASPAVRLDAAALEALFAAVDEEGTVACPMVVGVDGIIRTAGQIHVPAFGRWWTAQLLEGEPVAEAVLPGRAEVTFPPAPAFAVRRGEALRIGGFALDRYAEEDHTLDVSEFADRHRAGGGRVVLLPGAHARVRDRGFAGTLVPVEDEYDFGHPQRRTTPNTDLVDAAGIIAGLREPHSRRGARGGAARAEPSPLVFGRIGHAGSSAEELRAVVAGLEAAGLEPSTDLEAGATTVKVGADLRATLQRAARRNPPQKGEIWLTESDCWMAVAGEPALVRIPDPGSLRPDVRRALADPYAFAVVPAQVVADALAAEGVAPERIFVLPPYLGPGGPAPLPGEPVDVHAFLQVADEDELVAGLQALQREASTPRVTLTWPLVEQRALVEAHAPVARLDSDSLRALEGPDPTAGVVLALDGWDRYARRVRAALARGIPVVAERRYEALLDADERQGCWFVDGADADEVATALRAATARGKVEPPTAAQPWEERARAVTEEARRRRAAGAERPAGAGPSVLVATPWLPAEDESAGHLRLLEIVDGLAAVGADVTVVAAHERWSTPRVEDCLARGALALGVYDLDADVRGRLVRRGYDIVYAHFHEMARWIGSAVAGEGGDPAVVVDSVDLHYVRHLREAEVRGKRKALDWALDRAPAELVEYATADLVVVATPEDEETVVRDLGVRRSVVLTTIHRARETVPPAAGRRGILFVGSFQHTPNVDAVEWLMTEVAPRLAERGVDEPVLVAGSRMPTKLARLVHRRGGEVLGFVPRLGPVYDSVRCTVAPLRFGAGMKGKIGEALAAGLPTVTTTVGAEGFSPGAGIVVADDADAIADALARLCGDDALWERASEAGRALVRAELGPDKCVAALREIVDAVAPRPAVPSA